MGEQGYYSDQSTCEEEDVYMDELWSENEEEYEQDSEGEEPEPKPPDSVPYNLMNQTWHEDGVFERGEQDFEPQDNTRRSTWSRPHQDFYTSKSVVHFNPYRQSAPKIQLYAFSGKRNYLEWERNMDEWFHYKHIREEKRLAYAIEQLSGEAYKWWVQEKAERKRYKEISITTWRLLKQLLRKRYMPKREDKGHNTTYVGKKVISSSIGCDKSVSKVTTNSKVLSKRGEQLVEATMARLAQIMDKQIDAFRQKQQHNLEHKHNKSQQRSNQEKFLAQASEQSKPISSKVKKCHLNGNLNIQKKLEENKKEQTFTINQQQRIGLYITDSRAEHAKVSEKQKKVLSNSSHDMITLLSCPKEAEKGTGDVEECSAIYHSFICRERKEKPFAPESQAQNVSTPKEGIFAVKSSPHILLDTKIIKTFDLIQFWQHYVTGHSLKFSCFNVSISRLMHLVCPMSFEKEIGTELNRSQGRTLMCSSQLKENPPDIWLRNPKQWSQRGYLDCQRRTIHESVDTAANKERLKGLEIQNPEQEPPTITDLLKHGMYLYQEQENESPYNVEQPKNKAVEQLTILKTSLESKCTLPSIQSDFVPKILTSLEPEQPSSMISFAGKLQRRFLVDFELQRPSNLEPEHVLMPFPCDYPRKHCKEFELVKTGPNLFVIISAHDEKRFGLEQVKEFRVSSFVFDKLVPSFETLTPESFLNKTEFLFNDGHTYRLSMETFVSNNVFDMFRDKTKCALFRTWSELSYSLKNLMIKPCKLNVNEYVLELKHSNKILIILSNEIMFYHLERLFAYFYHMFDVFSLVFVNENKRQLKDSRKKIIQALSNQVDYGPSQHIRFWNWKYLRKTTLSRGFKHRFKCTKTIQKWEEDQRFKPPELYQNQHQNFGLFFQIKEDPPDSISEPKTRLCKLRGKFSIQSEFISSNLLSFYADGADLRTNPSQQGGNDIRMAEQLEPEQGELGELGPEEMEQAMEIPRGPVTRAKAKKLQEAVGTMLKQAESNLSPLANPTTLVVIQAS